MVGIYFQVRKYVFMQIFGRQSLALQVMYEHANRKLNKYVHMYKIIL